MPGAARVTTTGLREFIRAVDAAGKETKRQVRKRLREVGELVRDDARSLFAPYDGGSAAGYGVSVRRVGRVTVEQRRRKTTGKRPDYGALQMRKALLPAAEQNQAELVKRFEQALDDIADVFERS